MAQRLLVISSSSSLIVRAQACRPRQAMLKSYIKNRPGPGPPGWLSTAGAGLQAQVQVQHSFARMPAGREQGPWCRPAGREPGIKFSAVGWSCMSAGRVNLRFQHLRVQAFGPRTFGFSTFGRRPSGREPSGSVQHLRVQACGPRTFGVQHFGRKPAGREPSGSEGAGRRAVRTFKRLRAHRVILSTSRRRPAGREPGAGLRAENHRLSGTTSRCNTPTDNMRVFVVGLMLQSHFAIELNVDINNLILLLIYNCQTR